MPSPSYTQRVLISAVIVFVLSCLVLLKGTWETALMAPWILPAFIFENSRVMATLLASPFSAGTATVALILLAARRDLYAVSATLYFSLNIVATIQFLKSYDGHS